MRGDKYFGNSEEIQSRVGQFSKILLMTRYQNAQVTTPKILDFDKWEVNLRLFFIFLFRLWCL